jgi:hypothetical protein
MEERNSCDKDNLMQKLQQHNKNLKDITTLINAMTERKAKGKADFSGDAEMRDLIDTIRNEHMDARTGQSILPSHQYSWNDEKRIDDCIHTLQAHTEIISKEVNHIMMTIQQNYQEIQAVAKTAQESCQREIEAIQNIQRRSGR